MSGALQIRVVERQQIVYSREFDGPVELGRQIDGHDALRLPAGRKRLLAVCCLPLCPSHIARPAKKTCAKQDCNELSSHSLMKTPSRGTTLCSKPARGRPRAG